MAYFVIHSDGSKYGPADLPLLQQWVDEGRLGEHSLVENQETGTVLEASFLPGLSFGTAAPTPPPFEAARGSRATAGDWSMPQEDQPIDNHLVKAILATICCCLPLGVVSIVFAAQVDGFVRSGDTDTAIEMSEKADLWSNWSIGLGLASTVIYLIIVAASTAAR